MKPSLRAIAPWQLDAEGALIHSRERLAVIADIHLGYEWARGRGGDCVPAHSLAETVAKLGHVLQRHRLERLIVAGDLVESPRRCRRTEADVARLTDWLATRGVKLVVLTGNHDPPRRPPLAETLDVAGWTICHGHRPCPAARTISGHDHPVLSVMGVSSPCFLVSGNAIVLPAFSPNAAGCNVAGTAIPPGWRDSRLRCLVPSEGGWLDFGPVRDPAPRLHKARRAVHST